ncbi:hypothetical protein [Thiomicrorhabdus heinhorstiae]|uniref:Uncharacterized protein n=1 Tax=Thiomicrorhabdus heinhorstiae TaxID=2748010 RepID=A0ABS0BXF1_9GAMM|nr:hypothetical protein [Thiomicrorhabdus heinhorstiae]MBF6058074.1 hypothetical protein [Thiomicrorhabdus heinhorstiae]
MRISTGLALLICMALSTTVQAVSCSQSNLDDAVFYENKLGDYYNDAIDIYQESCKYEIHYNRGNAESIKQAISQLNEIVNETNRALKKVEKARKYYKKASDLYYDLHEACDGSNSDNMYDNYSELYDWANDDTLYGDNDLRDELVKCRKKAKGSIKELNDLKQGL